MRSVRQRALYGAAVATVSLSALGALPALPAGADEGA